MKILKSKRKLCDKFYFYMLLTFFLCYSVLFGLFYILVQFSENRFREEYLQNLRMQIELILNKHYTNYLFMRNSFLSEELLKELYFSTLKDAEKEITKLFEELKQPISGIKVHLKDTSEELIDFQKISFEPFQYQKYLGYNKRDYYFWKIKFLGFFGGLFIFSLLLVFFITKKLYQRFKRPLEEIVKALEQDHIPKESGYFELDLLIEALRQYSERERVLLETKLNLQREIERRERLATIGTLAGGYAHEFNNLLQMILMNYELALKAIKEKAPELAIKYLVPIGEIAKRGQNLAHKILFLTQVTPGDKIRLCDLIKELEPTLRAMIPRDIEFKIEIQCEKPCVISLSVDSAKEIILNLLKNAIDAIEAVKSHILKKEIKFRLFERNSWLIFEVSDTGCGMTEEVKAHIFDPFFTTKEIGKGTGLGLYIVYNLVTQIGGSIEVESKPLEGTTFRILFPLLVEEKPSEEMRLEEKPSLSETSSPFKTILIAEDEEGIRETLKEVLEAMGFEVKTAENGSKALSMLTSESYDLLLIDLFMPEMEGVEVLKRLIISSEKVPYTVLMTGYVGEATKEIKELLEKGVIKKILKKPFTIETLKETLENAKIDFKN